MGKLAERLSDFARGGVYRIESAEALEEAAALNAYPLLRLALDEAATQADLPGAVARSAALPDRFGSGWDGLARGLVDFSWAPAPGYVLLVSGFEGLQRAVPGNFARLLESLQEAAARWRERGRPFFVAFLDPGGAAPLAPLYDWNKRRGAATGCE